MLDLEWFTARNFAVSYKKAKKEKKMLVFTKTKQVVADFSDRKDKISNPLIEVCGPEGLLIVSRIVNFEHELRQVAQDVPVDLVLDKTVIARLNCTQELF